MSLSGKDAPPGKKQTRKTITLEQKVDIIRRYDRGESTNAIRNALDLPESTLRTIRKDKEKILAAFKAGAGGASTRVSLGQSTLMLLMEKLLMIWMDHWKHQGLSVTFNDTRRKAMECCKHPKANEMGPVPEFVASTGWFYNFKSRHAFRSIKRSGEAKSADTDATALFPDELRAIIKEGGTSPSKCLIWMRQAFSGKKCLNAHTSRGRRSVPLDLRLIRTVSPSCWGLT